MGTEWTGFEFISTSKNQNYQVQFFFKLYLLFGITFYVITCTFCTCTNIMELFCQIKETWLNIFLKLINIT